MYVVTTIMITTTDDNQNKHTAMLVPLELRANTKQIAETSLDFAFNHYS